MAKKKNENRISNVPSKKTKEVVENVIFYKNNMNVADLAQGLHVGTGEVIKRLMKLGIMATLNITLDRETVELIALDMGFEVKDEEITDKTRFDEIKIEDDASTLLKRPPVVTIMGHVDHGKTTLLDTIRHSRVVSSEAGGITQHIGAYQVKRNGSLITFIDTPGHAAFTEMRSRGAQITDITVLVVAADDGVMPQTEEAIQHAQAANVPIIVAVNKIDKPTANPEHVMQELSNYNLLPEAWGGKTIYVNISALKGTGIDELLDMIQLLADVEEYKANPNRLASGAVIEAKLDKGRGPIATVLVQNGTLKVGDNIVVGNTYGKVRAMIDDQGRRLSQALPSTPVEIDGLAEVPSAGDKFMAFFDEKEARQISEERTKRAHENDIKQLKVHSLEEMFGQEGDSLKELNLVIKGDTQGSIEALRGSLEKISIEDIKVNVVRSAVGAITDTDITLALASNSIVVGFNVRPSASVRETAKQKGVEIRLYNIIYKLIEEIEAAMKGMLDPVYEEVVTGQAEIRNVFKISKVGSIGGCYVTDGVIERDSLVRVIREGIVVYEGKMASLKRFKDDAKEVRAGFECGIGIEGYNDIKVGDIIEASVMKEKER